MSRFHDVVDSLSDAKRKALGRDLNFDEIEETENGLLNEWLTTERFDDLIDHALDEFDVGGGATYCALLSQALCKKGDVARVERLLCGLILAREANFRRTWKSAQSGHIGAMKESARYFACTMESLAELYHAYWALGNERGKEEVKAGMLRLQTREPSGIARANRKEP
ncbi:MAG: hypothetical protein EPN60_02225 [Nevskiaceae bacterium]|nr:MAG: hypothetical protein EPO48_14925 [Nevskiaceae bacterium]TAM33165.1 MAG: hypothetical protein EPN60_02225 [Nevskiaceae bacterium]